MMEQMYRRQRTDYRSFSRASSANVPTSYKKTFKKQGAFCLLLIALCLFCKLSDSTSVEPAKKTIQLMINTTTDFKQLKTQAQDFFRSLLPNDEERDIVQNDLLVNLTKPVEAPVTSPFGLRNDPTTGEENFHYGLDLGAPQGDKIKCAAAGTVEEAGENAEYGKFIIVRHSDTVTTLYAHCQELLPQAGDVITAGQVIATVGATGKVTGPHLHFEIRDGETWLDPAKFLDFGTEETQND